MLTADSLSRLKRGSTSFLSQLDRYTETNTSAAAMCSDPDPALASNPVRGRKGNDDNSGCRFHLILTHIHLMVSVPFPAGRDWNWGANLWERNERGWPWS